MQRPLLYLLILVVLLGLRPAWVRADVLNFDSLPGSLSAIPNGYGGLNWDNFWYLNSPTYAPVSGYANDTVSPPNVAFNAYANPASVTSTVPFVFNGADFAGGWNNQLHVEVVGSLGGVQQYDQTFVVDATGPTFETFPGVQVDSLRFTSSGGIPAGFVGGGSHFALDNFTFNGTSGDTRPSPEPAGLTLAGLGVAGVVGYAWRRRPRLA